MGGTTTGPLDCSGAGSLVSGRGGATAAIGVGGSGLTSFGVDFAGSAAGSKDSIDLAGSEGPADWRTTLSSFIVLSDSTEFETVTGSFDSSTGAVGAAACVLGLQSLVEEVW